ncbi:MAG TPA: lysylphosphatidylglycerol synthase transmembrane domain-containing protein [Candidatus Saccharimonadales bacterium]
MSFRHWVSIVSFITVILLVIFSWQDIVRALDLLWRVQWWVIALIIPVQVFSYYASGEILVSFLRAKKELMHVKPLEIVRFSLEFNFVNHVLPSGGLSGISYANWRFKHLGVSSARITLAQALRFIVTFVAYLILLLISLLFLALDGNVSRLMILFASSISTLIVLSTLLFVYIISSTNRVRTIARQLTNALNAVLNRFLRKRKNIIAEARVENFFMQMHADYIEVKHNPRQLRRPLAWGFAFIIFDIMLFFLVFASFGQFVNPAALLVAYGLAGVAGAFVVTPGGAGAYEAVMISVLASAGVSQGTAILGILLARVILIIMTIGTGYIFYQMALLKFGKDGINPTRR